MKIEPLLRLDDRFTHRVDTPGNVILVGDEDAHLVEDALAGDVVRFLDGRRTALEIASALEGEHRPEEVHYVLLMLLGAGLAREVDDSPDDGSPEAAPNADRGRLSASLAALWAARDGAPWIAVPPETWRGPDGAHLVLTDDYLRPELREAAPKPGHGSPRLLAGMGARRVWLGPTLSPAASCLSCLQDRLRLNLSGRSLVHVGKASADASFEVVTLPARIPDVAFDRLSVLLEDPRAIDLAATNLLAAPLGDRAPPTPHRVPRLPHCPACGDPSLTLPGAVFSLERRPRSGRSGGGYRVVSPEETLTRYAPLVSPLVGVVRRIERVPVEGASMVHVYTASHAHHYGAGGVRAVKDDRRDHSGGKGRTDADARASALCESLERFSSVHRGDEPTLTARRSELGDDAFAPNDLMRYSEAQFVEREAWNASQKGGFQWVPQPYADEPIEWSEVRSLATGRTRKVPSTFLFHGFRGAGARFSVGDSNGLAGGNCLEEAILQGFLELVERDAIALWWYNRARRPGVDLAGLDDPWVREVLDLYERLDRDVWALDLTTDLGIPTYAALSSARRDREQDIIFGFGAHLDARIALTRALTELDQMLPTILQTREVRRRRLLPDFTDAVRWWDEATLESDPYLLPLAGAPARSLPAAADDPEGDLREDVQGCVDRATAVGLDVLAYDFTRPDVGFPVAKVIVPGLRHFWRRLGPGRLYDVPVRLAWVESARAEDELNPVSMFV